MAVASVSRGARNNNPGNIVRSSIKWQGLSDNQSDPTFAVFKSPIWGIRALAVNLIRYYDDHDCDTVDKIIRRWSRTDQEAYIANVAHAVGVTADEQISPHRYDVLEPMVKAIIQQENGKQPYSQAQIDEALKMAGVIKPVAVTTSASLAKDPKVIAATVAGTAATVQATVSSVASIWDTLNQYIDPRYLVWSAAAVALALGVYFVSQRVTAHREGRA